MKNTEEYSKDISPGNFRNHFKTRQEAHVVVFEYVEIFYSRKRIHASNGYITSEEYYRNANKN